MAKRVQMGFEGTRPGISNEDLRESDVPAADADYYGTIVQFALTWDGYAYWGSFDPCAEIANRWAGSFRREGRLPDTLEELRTCLFFEQRRWRHFDEDPDEVAVGYIRALLEAIREQVRDRIEL